MRLYQAGIGLFFLVALAGCGQEETAPAGEGGAVKMSVIEGTVYYRERIMMRPGTQLEVQLQDISRADALATVMASVTSTPDTAPPYNFRIEYDFSWIDPRMTYALRATLSYGDKLLFTSTEYINPFGEQPLDILVKRVGEPVTRSGPALEDTVWVLDSLAGQSEVNGNGGQTVDLTLMTQEQRAAGFSGCNRYSGSYSFEGEVASGNPLSFGMMAGTLMACPGDGEIEQPYLQMLSRVTAYVVEDRTLSLLAGSDVVATFKPR